MPNDAAPSMTDLHFLSIAEAARLIERRRLSPVALTRAFLDRMPPAPQVVVPQIVDQPYWASRVAKLGIGVAHNDPTPTTESLSDALRTALTPEACARASTVSGQLRPDGAAVAARMLFETA